ncbi:MAG: tRNA lysidine(34) synthetase TilS [Woeseia sp.]|nr:tRNA lysidine(34) synthetase TilS [Woeseia sp.]|tara:strand:- start:417 stop:1745 length:1329 start_codon:yes stop_codon:yes gene_type:complete
MAFVSDDLLKRLLALTNDTPAARWLVAYSGGIDSTVLLHALAKGNHNIPILAIHIDHGLDPSSEAWAVHCKNFGSNLDIEVEVHKVSIPDNPEDGLEAAARRARYNALSTYVQDGDCVLSAHQENDQAETILMNLMRRSGLAGLAGIGARQTFGRGMLLRPLLGVRRDELEAYAAKHRLTWIEDPSNANNRFDRNFVRAKVLPILEGRWPAAAGSIRQSAEYAGEANELLKDLADIDIQTCGSEQKLWVGEMAKLSSSRQRNLLRHVIRLRGLPSLPAKQLFQVVNEVINARNDKQPAVKWAGGIIRRYRGYIYILETEIDEVPPPETMLQLGGPPIMLGAGRGTIVLSNSDELGLDPKIIRDGLFVSYRKGGEKIRVEAGGRRRELKKLFQEEGVFPWMRSIVPLLYTGDTLVAVGDLWVSSDYAVKGGVRIMWQDRPKLI